MIGIDQLAHMAYEAYAKACAQSPGTQPSICSWNLLRGREQAAWIAVAQKLRAEIDAVH